MQSEIVVKRFVKLKAKHKKALKGKGEMQLEGI